MQRMPTQREVERIRARYKIGSRIRLIRMDDCQAPPPGTLGTIIDIDDVGDLIVAWDNGSGLKAIPNVDDFEIITNDSGRR